MQDTIEQLLSESIAVKTRLLQDRKTLAELEQVAQLCLEALKRGNKILFAGNGGSASDAQHIAAELVGRFELDRAALPAIALTTNTSQLTAIANDYGYESLFSRQVQGMANKGDVFFGLSTSGNSANVVAAVKQCRQQGVSTVAMTGAGGGQMADLCDFSLRMPSDNTARIQEAHITVGHILCALIEAGYFA